MSLKNISKSILLNFGYKLSKLDYSRPLLSTKKDIHFIHIGRNAGSELIKRSEALNSVLTDKRIVCHSHETKLRNIDPYNKYFFSIRRPDTRFESAFYMLRDHHKRELTIDEIALYENFKSANELAESLFDDNERGALAFQLMNSVYHLAATQVSFFQHSMFIQEYPPLIIIRQEFLEIDWNHFLKILDIDADHFRTDTISNNRLKPSNVRLSDKAIENLARWYAKDWYFYKFCNKIQEKILEL